MSRKTVRNFLAEPFGIKPVLAFAGIVIMTHHLLVQCITTANNCEWPGLCFRVSLCRTPSSGWPPRSVSKSTG